MVVYAGFGRRLWGFVLDLVMDLLVLGAIASLDVGRHLPQLFLFWFVLHHVGLVAEGGSFGHRIAGLRVVRADGSRLGVLHAFIRVLVLAAASLPPLGLGVLWMLDERERRGWHDLAAGSVVVRELRAAERAAPDWASAPPWRQPRVKHRAPEPAPAPEFLGAAD